MPLDFPPRNNQPLLLRGRFSDTLTPPRPSSSLDDINLDREQENDGRTGRQGHCPHVVDTEAASNVRRKRQQKLIQQLTADNGVLKRKVAGYQLALQVKMSTGSSAQMN